MHTATIDASGVYELDVTGRSTPYTVSLSRGTIDLSVDDGESYTPAQLDFETPETVGVTIFGNLTTIKFTAPAGSVWRLI